MNFRLACPERPGSVVLPGRWPFIFAQTASFNSCPLNHAGLPPSNQLESQTNQYRNPECQHDLGFRPVYSRFKVDHGFI